jgi:hypothetical protein
MSEFMKQMDWLELGEYNGSKTDIEMHKNYPYGNI